MDMEVSRVDEIKEKLDQIDREIVQITKALKNSEFKDREKLRALLNAVKSSNQDLEYLERLCMIKFGLCKIC